MILKQRYPWSFQFLQIANRSKDGFVDTILSDHDQMGNISRKPDIHQLCEDTKHFYLQFQSRHLSNIHPKPIFRTKTRSTIHENHIETSERMCQQGQRLLTATEEGWRESRIIQSLVAATVFGKLQKRYLVYKEHGTPQTRHIYIQ